VRPAASPSSGRCSTCHASNGATFTDVDRQHLYRIKYQQADPDTLDEEVTAA